MKRFEKYLIRILIMQCICLIVVQLLLMNDVVAKHLSKVVYYEGVVKREITDVLEVTGH